MKQKLTALFAGMLAVLAIGALPAVASAETPTIDPETGGFPLTFAGTTGEAKLTTSLNTITSSQVHVHGEFETASTGWIQFDFTDVTQGGGTCTGTLPAGQPEGTVITTKLTFHLIMIDSTAQLAGGKPGILITPNEGHFATFKCPLGTITVGNTGIIGEISSPTCANGLFNATSTIKFESASTGSQKYKQIETTGTSFDLTAKTPLGTLTASEDAEGTIEFARKAKLTC